MEIYGFDWVPVSPSLVTFGTFLTYGRQDFIRSTKPNSEHVSKALNW